MLARMRVLLNRMNSHLYQADHYSLTVPGFEGNLSKYGPLKVHKKRDFNENNTKIDQLTIFET